MSSLLLSGQFRIPVYDLFELRSQYFWSIFPNRIDNRYKIHEAYQSPGKFRRGFGAISPTGKVTEKQLRRVPRSSSGPNSELPPNIIENEKNESEKAVRCFVEGSNWGKTKVSAEVLVSANMDSVWRVLTDYERLPEFIPNLSQSNILRCPNPETTWLKQKGVRQTMYWKLEATVVLELNERIVSDSERKLKFNMLEGDFREYYGMWLLQSQNGNTLLKYEVNIVPIFPLPTILLERIIKADLPCNMQAIAMRAEGSLIQTKPISDDTTTSFENTKWTTVENLPLQKQPGLYVNRPCPRIDEVHLRRVNGSKENGGLHHKVMAAITIQAPVEDTWSIITDYERLHEFIPNLAASRVLLRDEGRVHLLQEGCKCLVYIIIHAQIVLELREDSHKSIRFRMVEGDFDSFQGEWSLERLGTKHTRLKYSVEVKLKPDVILAEAVVEEVIYEDLPSNLCAIRDRVESFYCKSEEEHIELVYLEDDKGKGPKSSSVRMKSLEVSSPKRATRKGRRRTTIDLRSELESFISSNGFPPGVIPTRRELREHRRFDLETAIRSSGGFESIAEQFGFRLSYARKPRRYWDDFSRVKEAIVEVQEALGCPPSVLPTRRSIIEAGRSDLARAFERWGGMNEVARLLGLKLCQRGEKAEDGYGFPASKLKSKGGSMRTRLRKDKPERDNEGGPDQAPFKAQLPNSSKWKKLPPNNSGL